MMRQWLVVVVGVASGFRQPVRPVRRLRRQGRVVKTAAVDVVEIKKKVPGLVLAGGLGFVGEWASGRFPVKLSPLLFATVFGIVLGNGMRLRDPELESLEKAKPGLDLAKRRLLRAGIILYGAKITFAKILGIGWPGVLTDVYSVTTTLVLGFLLGKVLHTSPGLTTLVATGSAVCGCSAVAATQPIIEAEAHEVAAAVGVVVLCGTAAMFLYPALYPLIADPRLMGVYTGATVHELAGVVAAGAAMGPDVASTAVVTKLLRVFMLEPWILFLYYSGLGKKTNKIHPSSSASPGGVAAKGVPWFALGFIAMATVNSLFGFKASLQNLFTTLSAGFLASAMAALGLDTDLVKVRSLGWRPVLLALALWVNLLFGGFLVARALV